MRTVRMNCGSAHNGPLAKGCEHCLIGAKMVLFVSGKCDTGCFYCPVSLEKKEKDVIYANEGRVETVEEILEESISMDATGAGITGGDPLLCIDRTVKLIKILKEKFGPEYHIHLYTSTMDLDKIKKVEEAGLDEIRFHPSENIWDAMEKTPLEKIVHDTSMDVGIEIPVLPGFEKEMDELITYAEKIGIKFVNLNELEFSESNWDMMEKQNYELKGELSSAVLGSEKIALNLLKKHKKMSVHFCSSSFKDGVQLRNRLTRRAKHIAKPFDVITEDGTIMRGIVYSNNLEELRNKLSKDFKVPDEYMEENFERGYMMIAPWILKKIVKKLDFKCYIVEEYPTADCLEVERIPL